MSKEADARAATKAVFQAGKRGPYTEPLSLGVRGQRLSPNVFVDGLRGTRHAVACSLPSPRTATPAHSMPLPVLSPPHLIILDTLQGELVAVHPHGVAKNGQSVKLLQLEGLGGGGGMTVRNEEGLRGQAGLGPLDSAGADELHTAPLKAKSSGSTLPGDPHPHLCTSP